MNELMRKILFLPEQASSVAREIDELHYSVISITLLGAFAVAATAAYFILRYRRSVSRGARSLDADAVRMPGGIPFWMELGAILFLLALFVNWWVMGFRQFVMLETPPKDALEIYVSGKQWMWSAVYPNGGSSKAVIFVPVKRAVRLSLNARDVIHSFFVPEFRLKKDVIPGTMTALWFEVENPGRYSVFCTEYCGEGHSTMRAELVALPEEVYLERIERLPRVTVPGPEYEEPAVVGAYPREPLTLARIGERVAVEHGCMRCHTADGTPHIGPTWARLFDTEVPLTGGGNVKADGAYLTESMMDPLAKIRLGFPPVMPSYKGKISAPEIGAIVEYIRALSTVPTGRATAPLVSSNAGRVELPTRAEGPAEGETSP